MTPKIKLSDIDLEGVEGELLDRILRLLGRLATLDTADFGQFLRAAYVPVTAANYALLQNDAFITANFAGVVTLTLPDAKQNVNRMIAVRTIQNQLVNSAAANVVPLAGGAAGAAILAAVAGKWALLISDGTAWQIQMAN